MTAKVVTESIRKMINMSVISVLTIMLLKVVFIFTSGVNMKELDMNVINVNTKQHLRVILLNINSQSMKEWDMNVTSVNVKPQIKIIQVNIKSSSIKELGMDVGMNVNSVNGNFTYIKWKDEGVRYECDQCEYEVTLQSYLTDHK